MASLLQNSLRKLNSSAFRQSKASTEKFFRNLRKMKNPVIRNVVPESNSFKKPGVIDKPIVHGKRRKFPLYQLSPVTLAAKLDKRPPQKFHYFLVLDFEATCDSPENLDPQEIIEFPVLKVNSNTFETESIFHSYVRPEVNPILTPFCTELTGVIQSMVDQEPTFKEVFEKFLEWLSAENILQPDVKFAFATCGDPDLDYLLPLQCFISGIQVPEFMKQWINVKRSFCEVSPYTWPDNLKAMMKMCELEHTGDLHSGIDDAKNVLRVMSDLAYRGLVFDLNGWIKQSKP